MDAHRFDDLTRSLAARPALTPESTGAEGIVCTATSRSERTRRRLEESMYVPFSRSGPERPVRDARTACAEPGPVGRLPSGGGPVRSVTNQRPKPLVGLTFAGVPRTVRNAVVPLACAVFGFIFICALEIRHGRQMWTSASDTNGLPS
jgi:hypothetical protein